MKKYVYVFSCSALKDKKGNLLYKVGIAEAWCNRLKTFQTWSPYKVKKEFAFKTPLYKEIELFIHDTYHFEDSKKGPFEDSKKGPREWCSGDLKDIIRDIKNYQGIKKNPQGIKKNPQGIKKNPKKAYKLTKIERFKKCVRTKKTRYLRDSMNEYIEFLRWCRKEGLEDNSALWSAMD